MERLVGDIRHAVGAPRGSIRWPPSGANERVMTAIVRDARAEASS
jgi:hypothetical protein